MSIRIKKYGFKVMVFTLAALGFFTAFFSRIFLGDSVDLAKLESKSKSLFSNEIPGSIIPTAQADVPHDSGGCGDSSGDSGSDGGASGCAGCVGCSDSSGGSGY
jgi:hypothetical protein